MDLAEEYYKIDPVEFALVDTELKSNEERVCRTCLQLQGGERNDYMNVKQILKFTQV